MECREPDFLPVITPRSLRDQVRVEMGTYRMLDPQEQYWAALAYLISLLQMASGVSNSPRKISEKCSAS